MSAGSTANPASRSVPASASRVCVVVFVMSLNGMPCSRNHASVSIAAVDRLPRDGKHPVDVEQESVDVHEVQSRIATGGPGRHAETYGTSLIPARLRASSTSCEGSIPF